MKPNRYIFYFSCLGFFVLSALFTRDALSQNTSLAFGVCSLFSSVLLFLIGLFFLHSSNLRDTIFGYQQCPSCCAKSINVLEKFKATGLTETTNCFCHECNNKLKLHWSWNIWAILVILSPVVAIILIGSVYSMFLVGWLAIFVFLYGFVKRVPLLETEI